MDRRDYFASFGSLYPKHTIDEKRMTLTFEIDRGEGDPPEEHTVRICFEVCGTCDGRGTHVNPSIDSGGLSREDFSDDPYFAAEYFGGFYDQTCNECSGRRVVPVVDDIHSNQESLQVLREWQREESDYRSMVAAERRMECGF